MSIITTLLKPSAPSILVRLSDESGDEDCRQYADDSMNQETSQSLIPHSLEYGLGSANINPRIEDLVVIHLRRTRGRKGRLVTTSGIVVEIDSKDPKRVRTNTCPGKNS